MLCYWGHGGDANGGCNVDGSLGSSLTVEAAIALLKMGRFSIDMARDAGDLVLVESAAMAGAIHADIATATEQRRIIAASFQLGPDLGLSD